MFTCFCCVETYNHACYIIFFYIMYYIVYIFSFTRNTFRTKNKHSKIIYDQMYLKVV